MTSSRLARWLAVGLTTLVRARGRLMEFRGRPTVGNYRLIVAAKKRLSPGALPYGSLRIDYGGRLDGFDVRDGYVNPSREWFEVPF